MAMLGMFNMSAGSIEGADDPGRIYPKRQNLMSIVSVLSLLQLKGCDSSATVGPSDVSLGLLAFATMVGLLFIFFLDLLAQRQDVEC